MKRLKLALAAIICVGLGVGLYATTTSVLNPASDLSGKTLVTAEGNRTITGTWSFSVPVRMNPGTTNSPGLVSTSDQSSGFQLTASAINASINGTNVVSITPLSMAVAGVFSASSTTTLGGNLLFTPDNTFDIGATGATRPRDFWLGRNAAVGGTLTSTGTIFPLGLIDASGASAGQIKFPAAQNPSADVNTLDDYEEGAWVPVIGGSGGTSGQSYTSQFGRYIKIGSMVWIMGNAVLSAKGTITANVEMQGLPFTSANLGNSGFQCVVEWNVLNTTWVHLSGFVNQGGTNVRIFGINAASASSLTSATALTTSDITNTSQLVVACVYQSNQ